MNTPNCEIIRGEVSIFRGGAGGLLYFSSGSVRGSLCIGASVCPELVESANGEAKQINKPAVKTVEDLISDYVVPYVVEALSP